MDKPLDLVRLDGDRVVTDSRTVARVFGKSHAKVLRDIRVLSEKLPPDYRANFGEVILPYRNGKGGEQHGPAFVMTKDGFTLLAMGFTGEKALEFKLAYMRAFNLMADQLGERSLGFMAEYLGVVRDFERGRAIASVCGRGLAQWGREKPKIETRLLVMLDKLQPSLALH